MTTLSAESVTLVHAARDLLCPRSTRHDRCPRLVTAGHLDTCTVFRQTDCWIVFSFLHTSGAVRFSSLPRYLLQRCHLPAEVRSGRRFDVDKVKSCTRQKPGAGASVLVARPEQGAGNHMATNLEHVATPVVTAPAPGNLLRTLWDRATRSIQTAVCGGLHGHDPLLQVEGPRLFLRCTTCGHETPGWTTTGRRPRLRFEGDQHRHRLN